MALKKKAIQCVCEVGSFPSRAYHVISLHSPVGMIFLLVPSGFRPAWVCGPQKLCIYRSCGTLFIIVPIDLLLVACFLDPSQVIPIS